MLLAVILTIVGMQTMLTGFLADLMGHNRGLVEDVLFRVKRLELTAGSQSPGGEWRPGDRVRREEVAAPRIPPPPIS